MTALARPTTAEPVDAALLLYLLRVKPARPTIADMAAAIGVSSRHTVHRRLRALRLAGLVTWVDGTQGTLRPLVAEVPVGALSGPRADPGAEPSPAAVPLALVAPSGHSGGPGRSLRPTNRHANPRGAS